MPRIWDSHWEDVNDDTERLEVPGGWLVRTKHDVRRVQEAMAMVFVPDPNRDWVFQQTTVRRVGVTDLTPERGSYIVREEP